MKLKISKEKPALRPLFFVLDKEREISREKKYAFLAVGV
jgi:DNA phosphorothioation-dependent restriction protein DptG